MQFLVQRSILTGLALLPALVAFLLPASARQDIFTVFGLTGTLILWCALAVVVIHAASTIEPIRHRAPAPKEEPPVLLRPAALRSARVDLPDTTAMRQSLSIVLDNANADTPPCTPETAEQATARTLNQILASWNMPSLHALTPTRLSELFLLERLIRARSDEAGALAQLFQRADLMLDIRDQIGTIASRRAVFDAQKAAYQATLNAWRTQPSVPRPSALLLALQALDHPDTDLWHKIVLEHDPLDPTQREAALWCVRQPRCDRATVASFCAFQSADGHILSAARRGDALWLNGVQSVIEAWNAGRYTHHEIGLDPSDAVTTAASDFSQTLDAVARITAAPRWPDPRGLFTEYAGRPPRPRDNWCLRTGKIIQAPAPEDYFDLAQTQAA